MRLPWGIGTTKKAADEQRPFLLGLYFAWLKFEQHADGQRFMRIPWCGRVIAELPGTWILVAMQSGNRLLSYAQLDSFYFFDSENDMIKFADDNDLRPVQLRQEEQLPTSTAPVQQPQ